MVKRTAYYSGLSLLVLLAACANPVLPTGGPKDTTPPKLEKEKSTQNFKINFIKQPLQFVFDEFILLDKADQQVLISPPLEFRPTIEIKDKTVLFEFDDREVLKENTTYIINFGESVKDYTEGNIVPDMQYVFSTGGDLDSLQLDAVVFNSDEGKPAEKTVIMLYNDLSDSAVYKILPSYAARTDKSGKVQLKYMKAGTYQVVALKDENLNYKYDLTNEKAGFVKGNITLPYSGNPLDIKIFSKDPPIRITQMDSTSNQRLRIVLDPSAAGVTVDLLDKNDGSIVEYKSKTIDIYYADTLRKLNFILYRPGFKPDTINTFVSKKHTSKKLRIIEELGDEKKLPFTPDQEVSINFNTKISSINKDLIKLRTFNNTEALPFEIYIDSTNKGALKVSSKWSIDSTYILNIQKGALEDRVFNRNDSMNISFKVVDPETLGSIILNIDSLNQNYDYSIQLSKGSELVKKWIVKDQTSFKAEITGLPAEAYDINILEDKNKNGRIDKGSFEKKELPENIYTKKLEQLRQNWSIDVVINMNEFNQVEVKSEK